MDNKEGISAGENIPQKPHRLIPTHPGIPAEPPTFAYVKKDELPEGMSEDERQAINELRGGEMKDRYKERKAELAQAESLEKRLAQDMYIEKGKPVPEGINLTWAAIKDFQREVKAAQSFRKAAMNTNDPSVMSYCAIMEMRHKKEIDRYLDYGESFEAAYRAYIREENKYIQWRIKAQEVKMLKAQLRSSSFNAVTDNPHITDEDYSRMERLSTEAKTVAYPESQKEMDLLLETLKTMYAEGSDEYEDRKKILLQRPELPKTKAQLLADLEKKEAEVVTTWNNDRRIRAFWAEKDAMRFINQVVDGREVLETETIISVKNRLHEIEQEHQRSTIGGIIVGEPGVGKTTGVRDYLKDMDREYVYIDMSEDVTRYMLYGSKSIEFKSPAEQHQMLIGRLDTIIQDPEQFRKFVADNAKIIGETFHKSGDEATALTIAQLTEELAETASDNPDVQKKLADIQGKVTGLAETVFHRELAQEFAHLVKRNGWRDGIIIAAIRRNESVIIDEFNKNRNWSALYSLLTEEPGKDWYFADNDETLPIPKDWRMYFTANIGKSHGVFEIPEAFASRGGGKVIEMSQSPYPEEFRVALAYLCNAEGFIQRPQGDIVKLHYMIKEFFPGARKYLNNQPRSIPISMRSIRDITDKLMVYNDPDTGKPVYQASYKSFDQALMQVIVDTHSLYEDRTIRQELVEAAINVGLLLDDSVRNEVIMLLGTNGEEIFKEAQEAFAKNKKNFDAVVNELRHVSIRQDVSSMSYDDLTRQQKIY